MKCTLPNAVCSRHDCYRCGFEEKEKVFRLRKVRKGELSERMAIRSGRMVNLRYLKLKGVKK